MLDRDSPAGRKPATVLVTGFDPFGGSPTNPSWHAVHALNGRTLEGRRVVGAEIPTVFGTSLDRLAELMVEHQPELVVCTGQAAGRSAISLERVAINVNDARIPDNAGRKPIDTPVVKDGPAAYFTKLPIKAMLKALLDEGINAEVSQTAGTFVCNQVFYGLMHLLDQRQWDGVRGGLIHVPWLPEQGQPSMRLEEIVRGLELAITCALRTEHDIRKEAGALN
ncbi:pyroglutamyl-peptidase I [Ramlibacter pallidus]|uniref:Pyrrolidone-carboxylate peptidase n=1 Tax=Ramlibacter pallidus TaxID=2780087 RepID=A0ABR9S7U4_9BURK|nr:pyroglutamyl-peptidase I [Ramlibacter pallidus]MBE7369608.1 pyroglutamyl-peptidase I [Ramlibacter pallidus]